MGSELARLAAENYVVVTTFRRNGDAVPTPVWAAGLDGELVLWSARETGKVKRIRRDGRVTVQACDVRGSRTHGAVVTGRARLLGDEDSDRTRAAIARKYGLIARVTMFFSRLRGGTSRTVGIAIALDEPDA
ncbi:PPOX class F420-dependent oxidoreductase [Amycolatopsis sp. NPDC059021]|uniref:PPOX class F420-dependent oxidoreductase n=1 Tax=Amycolatopsis sp. NPDC059021 TaxID=3346704 RepID=UPI00366C3B06